MKHKKKLWIRAIDGFLPKERRKLSVIEQYRSRAMVRTGLLGVLLNPFLFLFESSVWDLWQKIGIALGLGAAPLFIVWMYRLTGRLKVCACIYILYCTAVCAWAQVHADTIHALYWLWISFLIVFSVLVVGVKEGGVYTGLAMILFWFVLQDNVRHGHTLGTFLDKDSLLWSMVVQIMFIQICYLMLMTAYDAIRNRAEVRAVMLRFTDDEAARLATVGERMGGMALELNEQLKQFQEQLVRMDGLAKRTDTKVDDFQKMIGELQERSHKLSEIAQSANS
ncbi:MAG: hypothetical protein M3Q07_27095 [Pseudobdellovibrionaceae bacterium]|nr:hypothetical protein [Pseudobdellovibrionaceae bacterium]